MKRIYSLAITFVMLFWLAASAHATSIPVVGLEADNMGTAAWNVTGSGPEAIAVGQQFRIAWYHILMLLRTTIWPAGTT